MSFFLRLGRDEAAADEAIYDEEDPEGTYDEGMPPSLIILIPLYSNDMLYIVLSTCMQFIIRLACRLTLNLLP